MSFDDWRDVLDEKLEASNIGLNSTQAIGFGILILALMAGGFAFYWSSRPVAIKADSFEATGEKPALAAKADKQPKKLTVHVCGAVNSPGVFDLRDGDRVKDAIDLGGGATGEANLDALNLAAKLTDGQKVFVPKKGEQVPADQAASSGDPSTVQGALVNINTAEMAQLDSLPGVGPVLAQRILDYRKEKGSFSSVEQLRNVEGIGPKKFENIKSKVTVN